ncbi:MAG: beta-glucosidase BglX [Bdellovibrionaceae bacterium]|nr:beta-glucosidase BglX [Pseudobdellovibrionaceae bacterium]
MKSIFRHLPSMILIFASASAWAAPKESAMKPFLDRLISRMTVEEKAGQLTQYSADMAQTGASLKDNYKEDILKGRVGSIFNAYTPAFTRELQTLAVEKTRLKIPLIFGYDVIHGHRTIFPIPLGESASWDLGLIEESARIAAREASADGVHWTFAPMADVSRDPRWGRVSEGAGEDPWLGSRIAEARVRGFQGKDLSSTETVLACVKHFAAYGAPQGGRDYNVVDMSERELFETYMPPYEAAVKAGAMTVMTSFNEIGGVPSSANRDLLTDLLRGKWKFKGFVVADYTAVNELIPHGVAADEKSAVDLAFNAGLDMDMQGGLYSNHIVQLVKDGRIKVRDLDLAVRRVLEAKYRLGLFEDPYRYSDEERAKKSLLTPEHRAHARQIARKSAVLLKNDKNVLPLKKSGTIALIGPFADNKRDQIGNWSGAGDWKQAVSLEEGLQQASEGKVKLLKAKGANVTDDPRLIDFLNEHGGNLEIDSRSPQKLIDEALAVAKKADVIVMALGESQGMSGEAASRSRIRLPENQQELLKAIAKLGKPVVLVLFNGRPLALELETALAHSILETWFLGTEAGPAIAALLFGDENPSGKLPMSFPVNEGQIPVYYSMKNTGRPFDAKQKYTSKYLDVSNEALYPFGWGLSYTKFEISEPKLSTARIKLNQKLNVKVTVANVGDRDGEEVVQLYVRDLVSSVTRPLKQLRGYQKVFLKKGESKELSFELSAEDLKFYGKGMKWMAEAGEFQVMVGANSRDLRAASFHLVTTAR